MCRHNISLGNYNSQRAGNEALRPAPKGEDLGTRSGDWENLGQGHNAMLVLALQLY